MISFCSLFYVFCNNLCKSTFPSISCLQVKNRIKVIYLENWWCRLCTDIFRIYEKTVALCHNSLRMEPFSIFAKANYTPERLNVAVHKMVLHECKKCTARPQLNATDNLSLWTDFSPSLHNNIAVTPFHDLCPIVFSCSRFTSNCYFLSALGLKIYPNEIPSRSVIVGAFKTMEKTLILRGL